MKKFLYILLLLFLINININVNAASICNYEEQVEINEKAGRVTTSYEPKIEAKQQANSIYPSIDAYINISIMNLTDDFSVRIKNDKNNKVDVFSYEDTENGILNYRWDDTYSVTNFTFELYTTDKTGCPDELHKTLYLTTPRRNSLHSSTVCSDVPEFSLCQEFVFFDEISDEEFVKQYDEYIAKLKDDETDIKVDNSKNKSIFIRYWPYFVAGVVVLSGGVVITVNVIRIINRKKESNY